MSVAPWAEDQLHTHISIRLDWKDKLRMLFGSTLRVSVRTDCEHRPGRVESNTTAYADVLFVRRREVMGMIEVRYVPPVVITEDPVDEIELPGDEPDHIMLTEARHAVAMGWCQPETQAQVMDPVLAEAISQSVAPSLIEWYDTACQNQNNADYYRGLVTEIGGYIGEEAYRTDTGEFVDSVLCSKVPGLVKETLDAYRCSGVV